jgi:VWFA-related protein
MQRQVSLLLITVAGGWLLAEERNEDVVFRSDVSLVRVDAQVVDRNNSTITGLRAEDFLLREEGRPREIRNFAREDMPVDVLLLVDVSVSMRPHVERIASAAHQSLAVLRDEDRVAVMVFDRATRLRLPFRNSRAEVQRELESLLHQEGFDGGTDITLGLLNSAAYVARDARPEARRAIVIVTDDQTERNRDEAAVSRALAKANAVLCALLAPNAMPRWGRGPGSGPPNPGDPWPGGPAGPSRDPLGDIILGRRGPSGGRRPVPGSGRPRTQSAGTAEIARRSGGDSLPVDHASALETTLARIRQRYALHFHVPEGVKPGEERNIEVALADEARRRWPDAEVRYRRVYVTPDAGGAVAVAGPAVVSRESADSGNAAPEEDAERPVLKRRRAVNEPSGPRAGNPSLESGGPVAPEPRQPPPPSTGGWRRADEPPKQPAANDAGAGDGQPRQPGWRKAKPGE